MFSLESGTDKETEVWLQAFFTKHNINEESLLAEEIKNILCFVYDTGFMNGEISRGV